MNKDLAQILIEELTQHSGLIKIDEALFTKVLESTSIPEESERFHESLPHNRQILMGDEYSYNIFSLRRILRNRKARDYQLTQLKAMYERLASKFGIYSSDALTRNLRLNSDIVNMMDACEHPFSVLGKFETYEINKEGILLRRTRPILLIADSGYDGKGKIDFWESANEKYEEERGILRTFKEISPERYQLALV